MRLVVYEISWILSRDISNFSFIFINILCILSHFSFARRKIPIFSLLWGMLFPKRGDQECFICN